jgi:hypothetical protein
MAFRAGQAFDQVRLDLAIAHLASNQKRAYRAQPERSLAPVRGRGRKDADNAVYYYRAAA